MMMRLPNVAGMIKLMHHSVNVAARIPKVLTVNVDQSRIAISPLAKRFKMGGSGRFDWKKKMVITPV
jgi:hypothetical protein